MVGLSKAHAVFPISLNVVKISGANDESIFLGMVRTTKSDDESMVRVWVAPVSGLILTAEEQFADQFGVPAYELVGHGLASLGPDIEALDK